MHSSILTDNINFKIISDSLCFQRDPCLKILKGSSYKIVTYMLALVRVELEVLFLWSEFLIVCHFRRRSHFLLTVTRDEHHKLQFENSTFRLQQIIHSQCKMCFVSLCKSYPTPHSSQTHTVTHSFFSHVFIPQTHTHACPPNTTPYHFPQGFPLCFRTCGHMLSLTHFTILTTLSKH